MPTLRPWQHDDLESLVANANSREVWKNLRDRFPHPYLPEHGRQWLADVVGRLPVTCFAIQCEGRAVGSVGVHPGQDIEAVSGEVGYWVGEPYWGRGLATAAVREVTTHAFDALGLHRVFAVPFARNGASVRVLEKLGFRREGETIDSALKDGRLETQLLYAITGPEWKQRGLAE